MTLTPKKLLILVVFAVALYFGYQKFHDRYGSMTNEELFSAYGGGGADAVGARTELEIRVQQDKVKSGDLMARVNEVKPEISALALSFLGRMKHKEGIPTYITMVKKRDHKRWMVNAAASDALEATRSQKSKDAIPPLMELLKWEVPTKDDVNGKDATEKVRAAAGAALEKITGENYGHNFDQWNTWWGEHQRDFFVKEGEASIK